MASFSADTRTSLDAVVAGLFPEGVSTVVSAACPPGVKLHDSEMPATVGMVAKRRREFVHGRHCARQALAAMGAGNTAVPRNPDRSPRWPEGWVGTISHTGSIAAAAISRSCDYSGLGLDIESAEALDNPAIELIVRPEELPVDGHRAKLLFSIKESIYKCLYPGLGHYFDFQDMEVRIDKHAGCFRAISHTAIVAEQLTARLQGRYAVTADWVLSSAWLPVA